MLIGYMRVSKADGSQSLDLQRDALLAEGVDPGQIYEDYASGAKDHRTGLEACLRALRDGDVLVIWKLDRLGRNLAHLVTTVQDLLDRGVGLRVLARQGAQIDTCRAQKLHPGPNRPLIDLMQPTENRVRRGRVFSGTCGCHHHVYHWAVWPRMEFLRPTAGGQGSGSQGGRGVFQGRESAGGFDQVSHVHASAPRRGPKAHTACASRSSCSLTRPRPEPIQLAFLGVHGRRERIDEDIGQPGLPGPFRTGGRLQNQRIGFCTQPLEAVEQTDRLRGEVGADGAEVVEGFLQCQDRRVGVSHRGPYSPDRPDFEIRPKGAPHPPRPVRAIDAAGRG